MVALYWEKELPLPALRIKNAFNEYSSREIILSYAGRTVR